MWLDWSGDIAQAFKGSAAQSNNVSLNFTNSINQVFYFTTKVCCFTLLSQFLFSSPSGIIDQAIGQLVSLIYDRGTCFPRGAQQLIFSASQALFGNFSPLQRPRSFLPYFILLINQYFCICPQLFLHPSCFHAGDIPCMESPFPTVNTKWSLVFRSFAMSQQRLKTIKPRI